MGKQRCDCWPAGRNLVSGKKILSIEKALSINKWAMAARLGEQKKIIRIFSTLVELVVRWIALQKLACDELIAACKTY